MIPAEAYNIIANVLEQNLKLGCFATFDDVNKVQQALGILKSIAEKLPVIPLNGEVQVLDKIKT